MQARLLDIQARHRQRIGYLASLKDFTCRDAGCTDPRAIVDDPGASLYCLDDATRRAIFVQLPPDVDLTRVPFVYQAQYERAEHLISVPYDAFLELSGELPDPDNPIFIYITGRSGSTLLHNIFNQSGVVASFAEPDVATQFVNLRRHAHPDGEPELRRLARATVCFLLRDHHVAGIAAHAIKFRSHGVRAMDLFQTIYPQAKHVFLYRNAVGYANSFYRLFRMLDMPETISLDTLYSWFDDILAADPTHLMPYLGEGRKSVTVVEQIALWWVSVMEWYLEQVNRGIPTAALRFEDLTGTRLETLRRLFTYCDLPASAVQRGLSAYDRDSQAGSQIAREDPDAAQAFTLSEDHVREVTAVLGRHPVLMCPGYVAPGTL